MIWSSKESCLFLNILSEINFYHQFSSSRGMFISDIPMHDASRDLMLMNEHWEEEWTLTQNLEILTDNLKKALADLESEKQKTDK